MKHVRPQSNQESIDHNQLYRKRKNQDLERLFFLASNGHYPLFFTEWFSNLDERDELTKEENFDIVRSIYKKISHHRSLSRQKVALCSLSTQERQSFIHSFVNIVESRLLDNNQELQ